MRVLFLANIPSPYRVDFFNELGKHCQLTVTFEGLSASDRDDKWKAGKVEHFKAIFLKGMRVRSDAFLCLGILRILKQKWDHIIIGGYSTPTTMLAIEYLRMHKRPFFLEADGGMVADDSPLKYRLKRHFISAANGWFSSGKMTTDYLVHYGAQADKCHTYPFTSLMRRDIEQAASETVDKAALKATLNIPHGPMILSIGQFIHRKGFDILLDAAALLPRNVRICIVGGEATEEYLQQRQKLELTNVQFVGFQTKQELSMYYKAADCFVLPTREDIWGLVINEAMMYGLPVITTNRCVAGMELITNEENGYIVPVNDAAALATAINNILSDGILAQRMATNNLKKISKYSIEEMAKAHIDSFGRNA